MKDEIWLLEGRTFINPRAKAHSMLHHCVISGYHEKTKKKFAEYGPFETIEIATTWAVEHHIVLEDNS